VRPFASKMRPTKIDDVVGQKHLIGPDKPLRKAIAELFLFRINMLS
jgi:putative ATPase